MQVGRKLYYENNTGNVIFITTNFYYVDSVTNKEQDMANYTALQPYQLSAVGMIQLDYGSDVEQNTFKYPCHIDITKNPIDETAIIWDTANPLGATLADVKNQKITQVKDLANQSLYTTVTSNGVTYNYSTDSGYPAFQKLLLGMVAGVITYPRTLYNINHTEVSFATADALKLLFQDISVREDGINTKINEYITQVKACTTIDQVNAIVVTF